MSLLYGIIYALVYLVSNIIELLFSALSLISWVIIFGGIYWMAVHGYGRF